MKRRIAHLAIWTRDLERVKDFYMHYFGMESGEKYSNRAKHFSSYFLTFAGGETALELMHRPDMAVSPGEYTGQSGLTHFSIAVESKPQVEHLTDRLRADGFRIVGEPRTTGDGFFESVVEDCEGNTVEISFCPENSFSE